jgi:hypothetical protein
METPRLKWVGNTPKDYPKEGITGFRDESQYREWRSQYIEGPPHATAKDSEWELENKGVIGLYIVEVATISANDDLALPGSL